MGSRCLPRVLQTGCLFYGQLAVGQGLALSQAEGLAPYHHNKQHHAEGVDVHCRGVCTVANHFRGDEAWRTQGACNIGVQTS